MGWDLDDIVQQQAPPAAAPTAPGFQTVAPHAAPGTGYGAGVPDAETNLSDPDYARFMAGQRPSGSTTKAAPQQKSSSGTKWDLDDIAINPAPAPPQAAPAPQQQPSAPYQPTFLGKLTDAAAHGATLGLSDYAAAAGSKLGDSVGSLITGHAAPSFSQELAAVRQPMQQFTSDHPVLNLGANVVGGLVPALATSPLFGSSQVGAPLLAKAANYARNVGLSSLLGGAQGGLDANGGLSDHLQGATTGAAIGGAFGGLAPLIGKAAQWVGNGARSLSPLFSQDAREALAGQQLSQQVGGMPIQEAPLPGMQPDLAQATGSPDVASQVRTLNEKDNLGALMQKTANNAAIRDAMIGPGGVARDASLANASQGLTNAVRGTDDVVSAENSRLWNHDALAEQKIATQPVKDAVQRAVQTLEPGLRIGMSGPVQQAVDLIAGMPEQATVRDLNSARSALLAIARQPPESNPWAGAVSTRLASSVMDGLDHSIQNGMPGAPATYRTVMDPFTGSKNQILVTPEKSAIPPNPEAQSAYQAARDFTRESSQIMGTQDAAGANDTNRAGVFTKDGSVAADQFFNFKRGSPEGAQNIQQMRDMLGKVEQNWRQSGYTAKSGLGADGVAKLRDDLAQHTADYVIGNALQKSESSVMDMHEQPNIVPNALATWLRTNKGWMKGSGLFSDSQMQMLDRVEQASNMLGRTENLRGGRNSSTYANLLNDKFLDTLISPWMKRISAGVGAATGYALGGSHSVLEGGLAGGWIGHQMNNAGAALKDIFSTALRDPQVAQDLMMKAGPGNEHVVSKATRALLNKYTFRSAAQAAVNAAVQPARDRHRSDREGPNQP